MQYTATYSSPLGGITLASNGEQLTGLWFDGQKYFGSTLGPQHEARDLPVFHEAARWLDLYFSGQEPAFTPPLCLQGSPFRRAVWDLLLQIPYGQRMTYGELAAKLARQRGLDSMSAQAVGGAVGHNPISLNAAVSPRGPRDRLPYRLIPFPWHFHGRRPSPCQRS